MPEVEVVARDEWIGSNLAELMKLLDAGRGAPCQRASPSRPAGADRAQGAQRRRGRRGRRGRRLRLEAGPGPVPGVASPGPGRAAHAPRGGEPSRSGDEARRRPRCVPPLGARPRADPLDPVRIGAMAPGLPGRTGLGAPRLRVERARLWERSSRRAKGLVTPDPRAGLRRILDGELARIFAGEKQGEVMDRMAAVMAVIEGYAEHVMDEASADVPGLDVMRERMDARRARPHRSRRPDRPDPGHGRRSSASTSWASAGATPWPPRPASRASTECGRARKPCPRSPSWTTHRPGSRASSRLPPPSTAWTAVRRRYAFFTPAAVTPAMVRSTNTCSHNLLTCLVVSTLHPRHQSPKRE